MALARVKTWNPGDTLTAADLNAEFNNILNNPTSLINLSAAGDVCIVSSAAAVTRLAIGTAPQALTVSTGLLPTWSAPVLQSYLSGCQITALTATTSGQLTLSSGVAADTTNVTAIVLSSSLVGTTTGTFIAGNAQPKMDTGPLAASLTYHIYVISSALGGSPDIFYSSSTGPTLPTGFTKSRRVASFLTTSTAGIRNMTQDGAYFVFTSGTVLDVSSNNPGTNAVTRTLTVPTGVNVLANVLHIVTNSGTAGNAYGVLSDLSQTDEAPSATNSDVGQPISAAGGQANAGTQVAVRTNASAQIRSRLAFSDGNVTDNIRTIGWFDTRGQAF